MPTRQVCESQRRKKRLFSTFVPIIAFCKCWKIYRIFFVQNVSAQLLEPHAAFENCTCVNLVAFPTIAHPTLLLSQAAHLQLIHFPEPGVPEQPASSIESIPVSTQGKGRARLHPQVQEIPQLWQHADVIKRQAALE